VSKKQFITTQTRVGSTNGCHGCHIAKCWNFEVLFFDNLRKSSQGYVYVGDGLSLVSSCVYTVN